jgi:hypothetical protein
MTVVQSAIVSPDGVGSPGWVIVRLDGPGLQPGSRASVVAPLAFRSAADGTWSRDLVPNTDSSPYYVITESADNGVPRQYLIHVEDSASAVWLADLVVAIPIPVGMNGLPYRGPDGLPGPPGPAGPAGPAGSGGSGGTGSPATTSASDLTSGTLAPARIADGSLSIAKLAVDIATQAELDAASVADRNRANHTGSQAASTIAGLSAVATSNSYPDLSNKPTGWERKATWNGTAYVIDGVPVTAANRMTGTYIYFFNGPDPSTITPSLGLVDLDRWGVKQ